LAAEGDSVRADGDFIAERELFTIFVESTLSRKSDSVSSSRQHKWHAQAMPSPTGNPA